jgi:hypothetical protein
MNEEISPYNPPGLDEYIRAGARHNQRLLDKWEKEKASKTPEPSTLASATGSASPRTDKFIHDGSADLYQHVEDMADFARKLETELNAAYTALKRINELVETNQNCSPNNHTIAVIAMDAIEAMQNDKALPQAGRK